MVNANKLYGKIVECGMTKGSVAESLGITRKTLSDKMSKAVFNSDEIEILADLLNINSTQEFMDIFFTN